MRIFEEEIKCKNCMNNRNHKCILFSGKNVNEKDAGCYVGIDKYHNQKLVADLKKMID